MTTPATQALFPVTPEEVENLRYVAAMLECHGDKFPVPSHVPPKANLLRQLAEKLSHSIPGDVGMLREALKPFAQALDDWGDEGGGGNFDIFEHPTAININLDHLRDAKNALAALTPSALSGGEYAEAFDILVDVQSALVLTADHSQGATVASFVLSSTQYERLNKFLHDRQHADPREPSAMRHE